METKRFSLLLLTLLGMILLLSPTQAQSLDSDGDGVDDYFDACPSVYGDPSNAGCPLDSDDDGVLDAKDQCPYDYGDPNNNGCPFLDSDQDGIPDNADRCPAEPAPGSPDGCPGDADGDGIPNDRDACPFVSGQGNQFGGVNGADGCPVDSDQDQIVDGLDRCPFDAGPPENGGCPTQQTGPTFTPSPTGSAPQTNPNTATDTPTPEPERPTTRLVLPTDGPCVLATEGDSQVNVRQDPSTDSEVIDRLNPNVAYDVAAQTTAADGIWYQVKGGWVAGFVVRLGGDCTTLGSPSATGVVIADPQFDISVFLGACPDLVPQAQTLPLFLQLYFAQANLPDPCAALRTQLAEFELPPAPPLPKENTDAILQNCPALLPPLGGMMNRLYAINPEAWALLNSAMTPDNACDQSASLAEGGIPPGFAAALGQTSTPTPRHSYASLAPSRNRALASAVMIDTKIAQCLPQVTPVNALRVREYALQWQLEDLELLSDCQLIGYVRERGSLNPLETELVNRLRTTCTLDTKTAYDHLVYTYLVPANLPAILTQDTTNLCVDHAAWAQFVAQFTSSPPPGVEPALAKCVNIASILHNRQLELTLPQLQVLLQDIVLDLSGGCSLGGFWALMGNEKVFGIAPPSSLACYQLASDSLSLTDGTVINAFSPWEHKVAVLGRAAEQVCNPTSLPAPDSDGDTLRDDVDACPAAFALTQNGCTDGAVQLHQVSNVPAPVVPGSLEDALLQEMNDESINPVYIGLLSGRPVPPSAVFQVTTGGTTQLYVLRGDQPQPIHTATDSNQFFPALSPDGSLVAYIAEVADGTLSLKIHNLERDAGADLLATTPELRVGRYPPTWTTDGAQILVTLLDSAGIPGIYSLDMRDPRSTPAPQLLIPQAVYPNVSPNGRYIVFERPDANLGVNIFVALTQVPSAEQAITEQPLGSTCGTPAFGLDSLAIFFTCTINGTVQMFVYGVEGVQPVASEVTDPQNPAPGPDDGFLGFDDGKTIYYGYADGTNITPLFSLEGADTSHLRWTLGVLP